jgi:hypothetical protein
MVPRGLREYENALRTRPLMAEAAISPWQVGGNHDEWRVIGVLFDDEDGWVAPGLMVWGGEGLLNLSYDIG